MENNKIIIKFKYQKHLIRYKIKGSVKFENFVILLNISNMEIKTWIIVCGFSLFKNILSVKW
jgi:hypothetical protein